MSDTIVVHSRRAVTRAWLLTPVDQRDPSLDLVDCVVVALGTDRLARADDKLPVPGDTDRRGWWGDLDAAGIRDGWPIGTRLWLLQRVTITGPEARQGSTVARAEDYTREALQPFVQKGVASRLSVVGERMSIEGIDVKAVLYRGPLPSIELRYATLWNGVRG
ncbi:phage gp46-like protein [Methylobacterium sp. OAE515]|uniref:phage GP46 family protein n=1 Tax=Methylobacterium sp. OAE515 TaxID=2817895 RepID=UPI00178A1356